MTYAEQLKNPLWQKKRLEVLNNDAFTCQICNDTKETLHVHHKSYNIGKLAWEYENSNFVTLCETCHKELTKHIKKHKSDKEFDLLKYTNPNKKTTVVIYTKGSILIYQEERWIVLNERS